MRAAIGDHAAHGIEPAALLVDTVFSSDGVWTGPSGLLQPAAETIRAARGLFIADEVQPGFGRAGEAFWGFARHGVVPDLVTMGTPMGNGHPIAGLAARPEVLAAFGAQSRYFNTFGGNPVSMAAAGAVLDVIEREGLQRHALAVGTALRERLGPLRTRHAAVGEVRGAGLFVGVELVEDGRPATALGGRIVNALRRDGVLLSATGPDANVLKIRPPLVFQTEHAELLVDALDRALGADRDAPAVIAGARDERAAARIARGRSDDRRGRRGAARAGDRDALRAGAQAFAARRKPARRRSGCMRRRSISGYYGDDGGEVLKSLRGRHRRSRMDRPWRMVKVEEWMSEG